MSNGYSVEKAGLVRQFKLIYGLISLVLLLGIIIPILVRVPDYMFLWDNVFFILTFLTLFYWLFFLRFTFFARNKWIKLVILFAVLPFITLLLDRYTDFQAFLDDVGIQEIVQHLPHNEAQFMGQFIRTEMLFFGIGSIISSILVGFRMIISIWRVKNRGTV